MQQSELEAANAKYAAGFTHGGKPSPPAKHVAVVTCMDARMNIQDALGFGIGDAHVIRNAGGRVSDDALRSLAVSQRLLGTTAVVVVHHTKCGMDGLANETVKEKIKTDLGVDAGERDFLPFKGLEQSVRDDLKILQDSPIIDHKLPVYGYVYDVDTGKISPVEATKEATLQA